MSLAVMDKTGQAQVYIPSQDLRLFVSTLFREDVSGRPYRAEKICGVHRQKFYYNLATNPEFVKWYLKQRERYRQSMGVIVDNSLMGAIASGDVSAIRTFYEMEGSINKDKKNGNGQGGNNIIAITIALDSSEATAEDVKRISDGIKSHTNAEAD